MATISGFCLFIGLMVLAAEGKPGKLVVSNLEWERLSDTSAKLTWDGEGDSYDIGYGRLNSGDNIHLVTRGNELTIYGLQTSKSYWCQIQANADDGQEGDYAKFPDIRLRKLAVSNLKWERLSDTSAKLTWDGEGDSYDIGYGRFHSDDNIHRVTRGNELTIYGLQTYLLYWCQIQAYTDDGQEGDYANFPDIRLRI